MDEYGIHAWIQRANGTVKDLGEFAVVGAPFIDIVFALKNEICLLDGDELCLNFNIPVVSREIVPGFVDRTTHQYTEKWGYSTGELEGSIVLDHFRFTKRGADAWIELIQGMPERLYDPSDSAKAVKVR